MSTETYKAIIKIAYILSSGILFEPTDNNFNLYLPLYESLIEHLDFIDVMSEKLCLQDKKIILNSIKLVTDLINRALESKYSGMITLAGRLKHVTFFSTVGSLVEIEDEIILKAIEHLKSAYSKLNENLNATKFDLSIKSHQVMLNNLFIFLDVSLNEYGIPATQEEYIKAGFTNDPRKFVVDNFSILIAMNLKIFVKDPNFTFKKRFHEELMMSNHQRTFPISLFIEKCTYLWLDIFQRRIEYPLIYNSLLSWELMIYFSMNYCLILWQETKAQLENSFDVENILKLLVSNIGELELELHKQDKSIEECLDIMTRKSAAEMRHTQVKQLNEAHANRWKSRFTEFDRELRKEVSDFVAEQRVIQLLKGTWVLTNDYGEHVSKSKESRRFTGYKFYFISLSPNRQQIYYKEYVEKPSINPSYEDLEGQFIKLADISDLILTKSNENLEEEEKKRKKKLIFVKGTISYEKITITGANNRKLLEFYTDTEVKKYVWLDGIKILKGFMNDLSNETLKQINSLFDVRRTTQLLALENKVIAKASLSETEDEADDEYYDLTELLTVSDGFYYK